jgi:plastocyanin
MKILTTRNRPSWITLLLSVAVLTGTARSIEPLPDGDFELTGTVKVVEAGKGAPLKDASNVAVWLVREGPFRPAAFAQPNTKYRMVQRDKAFEPRLLVVPVGSVVDFPNLDPWFHNVFSLYRGKRFDLGLYEAGAHKTIKFDRPGASYIFCNIHPEMAAVVLAVESGLYGVSDKFGRIVISHVPQGRYLLCVWYENADSRDLDSLARTIEVHRNEFLPAISVLATEPNTAKHKNKYGRDYDPKPGATDY